MFAVVVNESGAMTWEEVPDPIPGPGEVLIRVAATSVNRADTLQRQGYYPPPPGASEIMGLECSGIIVDLGPDEESIPRTTSNLTARATQLQVGDPVCALLAGGGYAELVAVPTGQVMPLPEDVDIISAGSIPEVAATSWSNLVEVGGLQEGQTVLIHGGAGGVGSHALQLAKELGATVAITAGTDERIEWCRDLGADIAINYNSDDFVERILEATSQTTSGANLILDNMGAKYLERNIAALAPDGRLVIIGMQGGVKTEFNIASLLNKRGSVIATSLRSRPISQKSEICREIVDQVWPLYSAGRIETLVDAEFPIQEVTAAHQFLEDEHPRGKVLLVVDDSVGKAKPFGTRRQGSERHGAGRLFPRLNRKTTES